VASALLFNCLPLRMTIEIVLPSDRTVKRVTHAWVSVTPWYGLRMSSGGTPWRGTEWA
jgi:hypothetical protein